MIHNVQHTRQIEKIQYATMLEQPIVTNPIPKNFKIDNHETPNYYPNTIYYAIAGDKNQYTDGKFNSENILKTHTLLIDKSVLSNYDIKDIYLNDTELNTSDFDVNSSTGSIKFNTKSIPTSINSVTIQLVPKGYLKTRKVNISYSIDGGKNVTINDKRNDNIHITPDTIKAYFPQNISTSYKLVKILVNGVEQEGGDINDGNISVSTGNKKYGDTINLEVELKSVPYLHDVMNVKHGQWADNDGVLYNYINYILPSGKAYAVKESSFDSLDPNSYSYKHEIHIPKDLLDKYKVSYVQYANIKIPSSNLIIKDGAISLKNSEILDEVRNETGSSIPQIVYLENKQSNDSTKDTAKTIKSDTHPTTNIDSKTQSNTIKTKENTPISKKDTNNKDTNHSDIKNTNKTISNKNTDSKQTDIKIDKNNSKTITQTSVVKKQNDSIVPNSNKDIKNNNNTSTKVVKVETVKNTTQISSLPETGLSSISSSKGLLISIFVGFITLTGFTFIKRK